MSELTKNIKMYKNLNRSAKNNSAVFFGADWLYEIPVAELAQDYGSNMTVYNRSVKGLLLKDTEQVMDACVCSLCPDKVFINIGENDMKSTVFNADEFAEKYEWLLYSIHSRCHCNIYILSIVNDRSGFINEILKKIAKKYGCEYVDIQDCNTSLTRFFSKIRFFLRNHQITFCEAMKI